MIQPPQTLAERYRHVQGQIGLDWCPIEAGLLGSLADNECPHGTLPTDKVVACSCWEKT